MIKQMQLPDISVTVSPRLANCTEGTMKVPLWLHKVVDHHNVILHSVSAFPHIGWRGQHVIHTSNLHNQVLENMFKQLLVSTFKFARFPRYPYYTRQSSFCTDRMEKACNTRPNTRSACGKYLSEYAQLIQEIAAYKKQRLARDEQVIQKPQVNRINLEPASSTLGASALCSKICQHESMNGKEHNSSESLE